ncbi:MAG: hypothetical protein OCD02_11405 [Spirochaetaceae bacterium]
MSEKNKLQIIFKNPELNKKQLNQISIESRCAYVYYLQRINPIYRWIVSCKAFSELNDLENVSQTIIKTTTLLRLMIIEDLKPLQTGIESDLTGEFSESLIEQTVSIIRTQMEKSIFEMNNAILSTAGDSQIYSIACHNISTEINKFKTGIDKMLSGIKADNCKNLIDILEKMIKEPLDRNFKVLTSKKIINIVYNEQKSDVITFEENDPDDIIDGQEILDDIFRQENEEKIALLFD